MSSSSFWILVLISDIFLCPIRPQCLFSSSLHNMQFICFSGSNYSPQTVTATPLLHLTVFSNNSPWAGDPCIIESFTVRRAHKRLKDLLLAHPEQAAVSGGRRPSLSPARLAAISRVLFWYGHSKERRISPSVYTISTLQRHTHKHRRPNWKILLPQF